MGDEKANDRPDLLMQATEGICPVYCCFECYVFYLLFFLLYI